MASNGTHNGAADERKVNVQYRTTYPLSLREDVNQDNVRKNCWRTKRISINVARKTIFLQ